jgi:hypothetical protein
VADQPTKEEKRAIGDRLAEEDKLRNRRTEEEETLRVRPVFEALIPRPMLRRTNMFHPRYRL